MLLTEAARGGAPDERLTAAARAEGVEPARLAADLASGRAVAPWALGHGLARPMTVGDGYRIKVNANFGTSPDAGDADGELEKLRAALDAGADAVMDLSTGGDLRAIRRRIREACPTPLGSVPIYEAGHRAARRRQTFRDMTAADMLDALRTHVADGVDFVTVHCGVRRSMVERLREHPRLCGVTSRGGSMLARWMAAHRQENPYYERYDEVLDLCRERDVAISLGDALRPGALADAGDRAQIDELYLLGELARRARSRGVSVMIEGPGHVPLHQIAMQMQLEKRACDGAPFYVLGPLVTDVAPGYDHITSAIGAAVAAMSGANFICYVTPSEHLRLPDAGDVRAGVMAARIAGHAADIANGLKGAGDWDEAMSRARKRRDWPEMERLAMDPDTVRAGRAAGELKDGACTMCGEFCALKDDDSLSCSSTATNPNRTEASGRAV